MIGYVLRTALLRDNIQPKINGRVMFNKFLGKGDKSVVSPSKGGVDLRGLEVTEDDPDTVWSMWDDALAEQDSRFNALDSGSSSVTPPPVEVEQATTPIAFGALDEVTQPTALEGRLLEQRKEHALQVVELYHHRIANTIRTLWGHKECGVYINNLIMNGSDGMGHSRIGFNQDAAEAMMALSDLHEREFGPAGAGSGPGSREQSGFAGLDKFR